MATPSVLIPPSFCQYSNGPCNQSMDNIKKTEAFFIYPSVPQHLSRTMLEAVLKLKQHSSEDNYLSWEDLMVGGQIIFCEICKNIRATKLVVANITTTNFNVLFELGYAIGLKKPILPVRDSSYEKHKKLFDEIGIFDTIGFEEFSNYNDLIGIVRAKKSFSPIVKIDPEIKKHQPIYYIKSPVNTDGSIKLLSCLKRSYFRFRTFDAKETSRLSLYEAYKQILSSVTIIAHLIDPEREGAAAHNARAAFVCGMALASGKHVLMLQEGFNNEPIDYRDIVRHYSDSNSIPNIIENIVRTTADTIQTIEQSQIPLPKGLLERIDLGDVAAENEIQSLSNYFVKTPQFQQVRQGHARLVIGRKGAGKTALFYGIRNQVSSQQDHLVLDLKPEGHQFTRLRESVLKYLSEGLQLHSLTAFWHYLLLLEVAYKLMEFQRKTAYQNPESLKNFQSFESLYKSHVKEDGDFSERLMNLVNRLVENFPADKMEEIKTKEITGLLYAENINVLNSAVLEQLKQTKELWILFDNIDKGFPTSGLQKEDVLIVRSLLEASRKLQRFFISKKIDCYSIVFLRRDVYDHLVDQTPDRGKESYSNLDWSDIELIKELLLKRMRYKAPELEGKFEDVWSKIFDPHISGENSFNYLVARTFLRPRDILNFVRKCMQISVSRGNNRVEEKDLKTAEEEFSEDMLNELRYEMRDIFPELKEPLLAFLDVDNILSLEDIKVLLLEADVPEDKLNEVINILIWFSFLGVKKDDQEYYAYQYSYNLNKIFSLIKGMAGIKNIYTIHPAFRQALLIKKT